MTRKNNPKQAIENIITISAKLFAEKGYDKTSMQNIVDASGMSKGGIFITSVQKKIFLMWSWKGALNR